MIPGANTYAIPLMSGHKSFEMYDNGTITEAAICVIIFQVAAIATYYQVKTKPKRGPVWRESISIATCTRFWLRAVSTSSSSMIFRASNKLRVSPREAEPASSCLFK